jgi:GT2 family glycosyltransferase
MQPLVSILIPAYNAERWIGETIHSAFRQTWPNKEIVIIDDGSTDRTLSIAQKFAKEGVIVESQKNQGASAARNKAFSLCRGDYIQWLDADDLLAPNKISQQMEVAERISNPNALLSSGWGRFMYRASNAKFSPNALWADLSPVEWLFLKFSQNLFLPPAAWLVSRELTETAAPWDERLSLDDDGEYFARVMLVSEKIQFVSDATSYYRASGSSSLSNVDQSAKKLESLWLSLQLQIIYLRRLEDTQRIRSACATFLQNWLKFFYPWRMDIVEEAQQLAKSMGESLELPRLRRKYAWIETFGGRRIAALAEQTLPNLKMSLARSWDKAMFQFEQRGQA